MTESFVYIAGAYRADNDGLVRENIEAARTLAILCANHKIKHFCPHTHSDFMHRYAPLADHHFWLELDEAMIRKVCNCMLMVHNWSESSGAQWEHALAQQLEYPIYYNFDDLLAGEAPHILLENNQLKGD